MSPRLAQNRAILGAFYTQYVALLLIVLSFLIGGRMGSGPVFQTVGVPLVVVKKNPEPRRLVDSEITHDRLPDDLFSRAGDAVANSARLLAFASIAREHDVRLEFFLPNVFEEESLISTDRRLQTLDEFLVRHGVPPSAFRVWRTSRPATDGVQVTAYRQRWRGSAG